MQQYTLAELKEIATYAAESKMYGGLTEAQAFMRLLEGQSLGLSPTTALGGFSLINGKVICNSATTAILLHNHGYTVVPDESTDQRCAMTLWKDSKPRGSCDFTLAEARRAQLVKQGSNWEKWPKDMLWARCLTRLAREYAAHVFGGAVYAPGEIEGEDTPLEMPAPPPLPQTPPVKASDELVDAMKELSVLAIQNLGLERDELIKELYAFGDVDDWKALDPRTVKLFATQHYEGVWELVQMLKEEAGDDLEALKLEYSCYAKIPWERLDSLAESCQLVNSAEPDGDGAANDLFGTETGIVHG